MALEGLYVPISAPWYVELKSELLGFPAAKHDDQVDALGLIGQLLDQMVVGQRPNEPVKPGDLLVGIAEDLPYSFWPSACFLSEPRLPSKNQKKEM